MLTLVVISWPEARVEEEGESGALLTLSQGLGMRGFDWASWSLDSSCQGWPVSGAKAQCLVTPREGLGGWRKN